MTFNPLKDDEEARRIINEYARKRIYITTERRYDDWIAYTRITQWESGRTELEAVQKLIVSIKASS